MPWSLYIVFAELCSQWNLLFCKLFTNIVWSQIQLFLSFLNDLFLFYVRWYFSWLHIWVKVSDILELEAAMSFHVGAENWAGSSVRAARPAPISPAPTAMSLMIYSFCCVLLLLLLVLFWERFLLCCSCCPGTYFVDPVSLELTDIFCSRLLNGQKVCARTPRLQHCVCV